MTARPRALVDSHELLEQLLAEVRALRAEVQGVMRARAALDAGRARAIAAKRRKGSYTRTLVVDLAAAEQQAGRGGRGLAGRVARKLQGKVSESQVRKILRALSCERDFLKSNDADKGDD